MRPKNLSDFDTVNFAWIKNTARIISAASNNNNLCSKLPEEIGLMLTYKCNLRCKHCFQWNDDGYFNQMSVKEQRLEMDIKEVGQILEGTTETNARLYLWGGEPLIYSNWDELIELLIKYPRTTTLCTNAIVLEKRLNSINMLPVPMNLLISMDGIGITHDKIRGNGTFNKLQSNLKALKQSIQQKEFKGKVSINCMVSNDNIDQLYEICKYCEDLGIIDTLFLCLPWYISESIATEMDQYYHDNFAWLNEAKANCKFSWRSFNYKISEQNFGKIEKEIEKINSKEWNLRVRFRPDVKMEELRGFLKGEDIVLENKTKCYAAYSRMDFLPDGMVTSCKHFPEFKIHSIKQHTLEEIWHSDKYNKIRSILNKRLTPVCSKCVLLYLNGK